jgi:hypothetical protein
MDKRSNNDLQGILIFLIMNTFVYSSLSIQENENKKCPWEWKLNRNLIFHITNFHSFWIMDGYIHSHEYLKYKTCSFENCYGRRHIYFGGDERNAQRKSPTFRKFSTWCCIEHILPLVIIAHTTLAAIHMLPRSYEFGTALTTTLPILFHYCYKYCYSDSRNLWAVMKAGGLAP